MTSDREKWTLRGPVRALRIEVAEPDPLTGDWDVPKNVHRVTFDHDGRLAGDRLPHAERSIVDDRGRHATVRTLPAPPSENVLYGIEGSEFSYGAPAAVDMVTVRDERGRPLEVVFRDAHEQPIRRITFTRDEHGRVLSEDYMVTVPFDVEFREAVDAAPPEAREQIQAAIAQWFGPRGTFSSARYTYDPTGRAVTRDIVTGNGLSEERSTYEYDGHDNRVFETTTQIDRQQGTETTRRHTLRIDYVYDAHGNWIERVVWSRIEPTADFHRSHIERRSIEYFDE